MAGPTNYATPPTTSRTGAWSKASTCRQTSNCGTRSHRRCVENGASRDELHGVVTLREGVVDIAQLLQ